MAKVKIAVISGGNRGLGLEIGRQLLAAGVNVVLGSRDAESGQKAAESLMQKKIKRSVALVRGK